MGGGRRLWLLCPEPPPKQAEAGSPGRQAGEIPFCSSQDWHGRETIPLGQAGKHHSLPRVTFWVDRTDILVDFWTEKGRMLAFLLQFRPGKTFGHFPMNRLPACLHCKLDLPQSQCQTAHSQRLTLPSWVWPRLVTPPPRETCSIGGSGGGFRHASPPSLPEQTVTSILGFLPRQTGDRLTFPPLIPLWEEIPLPTCHFAQIQFPGGPDSCLPALPSGRTWGGLADV